MKKIITLTGITLTALALTGCGAGDEAQARLEARWAEQSEGHASICERYSKASTFEATAELLAKQADTTVTSAMVFLDAECK
jgi:hypothetical protein